MTECAVCGATGDRCTFERACSCWRGVPCRVCAWCGHTLVRAHLARTAGALVWRRCDRCPQCDAVGRTAWGRAAREAVRP